MKDILPIAAIALLLAANKNKSVTYKPPIRLTYDCFRGCNWRVAGDCWSRDYDWTVTAEIPCLTSNIYLSRSDAEIGLQNAINNLSMIQEQYGVNYGPVMNPVFTTEPNPDYDPERVCTYLECGHNTQIEDYWHTETIHRLSYWSYLWPSVYKQPKEYWRATSKSWDYSNPESFYAEQAQAMTDKAYAGVISAAESKPQLEVLPLSSYDIKVSYTKEFNECAEKDMRLDMLVAFVEKYVIDYLVKQYIPLPN